MNSDLWNIIKQFWPYLIGLIITVGAVVWFIAHTKAEPGKKVSVFWGMIEYTKSSASENSSQIDDVLPTTLDSLSGQISLPPNNAKVPRHFSVKGTITGSFRNLWLLERVEQLYWPKEPKLHPHDGRWTGEVHEGGNPPGRKFELLLVDVADEVNAHFLEYFQKRKK